MKIEYTRSPNTQDIDFLTHKINEETSDFGEAYPFAFFIRDEKGEIIAGCTGSVIYGSIYTHSLSICGFSIAPYTFGGSHNPHVFQYTAGVRPSLSNPQNEMQRVYTDQLWVHPRHRKQGLARNLMERVHAYGRDIGCQSATVTTMSFQKAQPFYENMGYEVEYDRKGYAKGSSLISLKKVL